MKQTRGPKSRSARPFVRWLLHGLPPRGQLLSPSTRDEPHHRTHPWWQVMCLTGVDYFSTLGYQPGIAALAAGTLSPIATLILVLLTLFGALPIYRRVAAESPHGEGSIAILEHLFSRWQSKVFVLILLGFVATDFVITITLSAADATAHITENPFVPEFLQHHEVLLTLVLIAFLGAIFLIGFKEAIRIAVLVAGAYLLLNLLVVTVSLYQVATHPRAITDWTAALFTSYPSPLAMIGVALILFPKLALGLSGFETGVAVMPLVHGDPEDTHNQPSGRVKNTRKLLLAAALTMSVFLLASSFVTTVLIPAEEFLPGGQANGRALAYLAHQYLGDIVGTLYDVSTILILWFAGASAMAGLLNIVPRYLPRYGMAPHWAGAARPLALVITAIAFVITILFEASVEAQGGAYATGVLVLMTTAATAVTISASRAAREGSSRRAVWAFGLITLVFVYTTVVNIIERPEGIKIASFFIGAIIATSLLSRVWRSTELRVERIEIDETAQRFLDEESRGTIHVIANQPDERDEVEYRLKEMKTREDHRIPFIEPVLFLEVEVADASEFADVLEVHGVEVNGYRVLRAESSAVPNAIAALLLYIRDKTGKMPHAYFTWGEENPLKFLASFLLSGHGDVAPLTREILRQAEPDPEKRPFIHVGG